MRFQIYEEVDGDGYELQINTMYKSQVVSGKIEGEKTLGFETDSSKEMLLFLSQWNKAIPEDKILHDWLGSLSGRKSDIGNDLISLRSERFTS